MRRALPACLVLLAFTAAFPARACDVAGLKLEEAIARSKELQGEANAQVVRDLRTLRDAAIVLDAYKFGPECERLVAILNDLVADPETTLEQGGDTDEDKAEEIEEARKPKPSPETEPSTPPGPK